MTKQKYIIITIITILLIYLVYKLAHNVSAGSYPYAEKYILEYNENTVKAAINQFKQNNKQYIVPKVSVENQGSWELIDEPKGNPAHWFGIYFYYKDENKIVFTLIRSIGKNKTEFSFVAINNGLNIGNWKNINNDFNYSDNKKEKERFENEILSGIKKELNK